MLYDELLPKAKTRIITGHYFFGSTLLKRPIVADDSVRTASMDVRGQITVSPRWVQAKQFTVGNMVFLLCHECLHYMLSHCLRRNGRDPKKWNWACDAWINETLIAMGVGDFIEDGIRYAGAADMSVEQLYPLAPENPPGDGGGSLGPDIDDSGAEGLSESELADLQADAKIELAQAAQAARQMGALPAQLEALVQSVLHVETPWYKHLEQFMSRAAANDYSWLNADRRFVHHGLYLPGEDGVATGEVAIISDESGSIGQRLREYFGGHVNTVMASCEPERIHLLHVSTHVAKVEVFEPQDMPIPMRSYTSGGTDMRAGIDWVVRNCPNVEAIIVLTDGYTPFGSDPGIPVFWAITSDVVAPFGQTVRLREAA